MNSHIYIVTCYGCNSTPSDLWTPYSKIFNDLDTAYAHFLSVSPSLDDKDNAAEKWRNDDHYKHLEGDYVVIENRRQLAYSDDYDLGCAKRPEGAVIARMKKI